MKRTFSIFAILFAAFFAQMISNPMELLSGTPSAPIWFQQTGFDYDSTTNVYTIHLKWKDGVIDEAHPKAAGYNLYRTMIGHTNNPAEFELVATIQTQNITGEITYSDNLTKAGGFLYYLRGYANGALGEISPIIQAFSLGSYCVNLDAEIVDFITYPETIGIPGTAYKYEAFAKHRSLRVQGWVRYSLLESPEGMLINEKSGEIEWNIPANAEGDHYVKLKAYSLEDSRAESIQEWYIRIANKQEIASLSTSVDNDNNFSLIKVYPNPAVDFITIQNNEESTIRIFDMMGIEQISESTNQFETEKIINVSKLPVGVYTIKIGNKIQKFVKN